MDSLPQAVIQSLVLAAVLLPMGIGLNLIFGVMHVLNFAHGEFYMLGAFFTWLIASKTSLGFFPSMVLAVIVVVALSLVVERVLLRPLHTEHLAALIVTIGLSLMLQTSILLIVGSDVKHYAFPFEGLVSLGIANVSADRLAVAILGLLSAAICYVVLQRTKLGKAVRAVAQDRFGATLQGINPSMAFAATMGLGTGLAAIAGALAGSMFGVDAFMGHGAVFFPFVVITLGGLGSIGGTIIAAIVMATMQSFVTVYVGAMEAEMAAFVLLYAVLLFRPYGMFGRVRTGIM